MSGERRGEEVESMPRTPGFRRRPSKYWVGIAPSGRAKCRTCKRNIEKGHARLVALEFVCPGKSCKLVYHALCVTPKLAKAVLDVCGDVNRVPISADVSEEARSEVRAQLLNERRSMCYCNV